VQAPQPDILVQRVDQQGQGLGSALDVTGDGDTAQAEPALAAGQNGSLLVWEDGRNEGTTGVDLYGQLLDQSGQVSGTVLSLSQASDDQLAPAVAYNSQDDEYLVAWHDYRNVGSSNADIYAQILDSNGTMQLTSPLSLTVANKQAGVAVAYNADQNTYLLVWEDRRPGTTNQDVYGQVISADGSLAGSSLALTSASSDQAKPAVAYSEAGGVWLAVWYDKRNSSQWDIYGQIISGADGSLAGSNFGIATPGGSKNDQELPDVVARSGEATAEFVVVWQDRRNDSDRDIYLQRVDAGGNLLDEPDTGADETDPAVNVPVAVDSSAYFERPAGAYDPDSGVYLLGWTSWEDGGVYVQRYAGTLPITPTASFTAMPSQGPVPLTVVFSDSSTGQIGERDWDFDDGWTLSNTSLTTVTHTYLMTGTFTAILTATNPGGSSTASQVITVTEQLTPTLNEDFELYDVGVEEPQYWLDQKWDTTLRDDFEVLWAGDSRALGTTFSSTTLIYSHYTLPGSASWQNYEYHGRMKMSDAGGGMGVSFYSGYPQNEQEAYILRRSNGSTEPFELTATGTTLSGDTDLGVIPAADTWYEFRMQVATHPNRVNVRARVWAEGQAEPAGWQALADDTSGARLTAGTVGVYALGAGDKYFDNLVVTPLGLQSDFIAAEPRAGVTPLTINFTAEPLGQVLTYTWHFGDGSPPEVSSTAGLTYTYTSSGTFDVGLTVANLAGSDTLTRTAYIETYSPSVRVTEGLQLLYTFEEGSGATVSDVSGVGTPLDLTIDDEDNAYWVEGGLVISDANLIVSDVAATKIISAAKDSDELTIEAWLKPANTSQDGPARIVSVSADGSNRNFTLGQDADDYQVRLRTTATNNNGSDITVASDGGLLTTELTHVVYTRAAGGQARLYLDNQQVVSTTIGGDLSNWNDAYKFMLADELTGGREWLGELDLVAVYSRALSAAEVEDNYQAGPNPTEPEPVADVIRYVATNGVDSSDCSDSGTPCATVQYAVDQATTGDEVRIATGVYTNVITRSGTMQAVYVDKGVYLRGGFSLSNWSIPDPVNQPTTLDAQQQGRVVSITGPITPTIEGLRLINGRTADVVDEADETNYGGGVYIITATATLTNNWIIGNQATGVGGGVFLQNSDSQLGANVIKANTAEGVGGGLAILGGAPLLIGNTISENSTDLGGGVYLYQTDASLINNMIVDNQAAEFGGGFLIEASAPTLVHTTIARNGGDGAGLFVADDGQTASTVALTNTILVSQAVGITVTTGNTATLAGTLWGSDAWANGLDWGGTGTILTGTVNLWEPPGFLDPDEGDYHLTPLSAAIDEGLNAGVTSDIDGETRPFGSGYDLGADEVGQTAAPALSLSKSGPAVVASPNDPITYTITITNNGFVTATNLVISDVLPAGASYLSGGTLNGNVVNWSLSSLGVNTSTLVTFAVTAATTITNSDYSLTANGGLAVTGQNIVVTAIRRNWSLLTSTVMPPVVNDHVLAYDSGRERVVLYGGDATGWDYEDTTWEFDGSNWNTMTVTTRPQVRYGTGLAYDSQQEVAVLFGGSDQSDTVFSQLWEYDGLDWNQRFPTFSPVNRTHQAMTANPDTGQVYIFGGNNLGSYFSDLWRYDNGAWSVITSTTSSPPARTLAAMTYDSDQNRLLLFGGRDASGRILDDFWIFDLNTAQWSQITDPAGPPARMAHTLTYDPDTGEVILVGGVVKGGLIPSSQVWHYHDQTGWLEIEQQTPLPPWAYHQVVYDQANHRLILVAAGEVWKYE